MKKIDEFDKIKALKTLLEVEKELWVRTEQLEQTNLFENIILKYNFDISKSICEILNYKENEEDWVYDRIYDYISDKCTLEEIIKELLLED